MAYHRHIIENALLKQLDLNLRSLGKTRHKSDLLGRKIGMRSHAMHRKPSMLRRLMSWMAQLAFLRKKEIETISLIQSIEKKHMQMRNQKGLRLARSIKADMPMPPLTAPGRKRRPDFWWQIILAYILMREMKPKKKALKLEL